MKTLQEIKAKNEKKRDILFKECGVFFAFSDKQFQESKTPLKEGEKYVSFGSGCFLPKTQATKLEIGLQKLSKEEKEEIIKEEQKENHIKYELANYESYYTGDITDALAILPYSEKEVLEVFNREKDKEDCFG